MTAKAADLLGRTPLKGGLVVCTKSNQCKHLQSEELRNWFVAFLTTRVWGGLEDEFTDYFTVLRLILRYEVERARLFESRSLVRRLLNPCCDLCTRHVDL